MTLEINGKLGAMTLDEQIQIEDTLKNLGYDYSIVPEADTETPLTEAREEMRDDIIGCAERLVHELSRDYMQRLKNEFASV